MVGGLGAHVGAQERWQRRVGGWYREGVQAIGGCGEGTLGENMGSKEWRRGGGGGDPAAGGREGLWWAGGCENFRDGVEVWDQERTKGEVPRHEYKGCQRTEGDTWRSLLDRLGRAPRQWCGSQ